MTNIVWSNGNRDPWSAGGVTKNVTEWNHDGDWRTIALFIEKSAHHTDLRAPSEDDPQTLKDARNVERMHIQKWIDEYRAAMPTFKSDPQE